MQVITQTVTNLHCGNCIIMVEELFESQLVPRITVVYIIKS